MTEDSNLSTVLSQRLSGAALAWVKACRPERVERSNSWSEAKETRRGAAAAAVGGAGNCCWCKVVDGVGKSRHCIC